MIKFLDLQNVVEQIKLDIFTQDADHNIKTFDYSKISFNLLDNPYSENYKNYKEALAKIDDLYQDYSTDYQTQIEFVKALFTCIKNEISQNILKSNNSLPLPKQSDINYYENKKKEYLNILIKHSTPDISVNLIKHELQNQKAENLMLFIDDIENQVNEIITHNNLTNSHRLSVLEYVLIPNLNKGELFLYL